MRLLRWALKRLPLRGSITRVETTRPVVALTFDDGPDPACTPELLELLGAHDARATFFMLGIAAARHPELVERVAGAGHAIGNHTWDHPVLSRTPLREVRSQIRACQRALRPHGRRLFRPPYFAQSKVSVLAARLLGFRVVLANVDSGDWWNGDGRGIGEYLLGSVSPGDIVLLHDGLAGFTGLQLPRRPLPDRGPMLEGLARFLDGSAGRLRCVTVPELLREGRPFREERYPRGPKPIQAETS